MKPHLLSNPTLNVAFEKASRGLDGYHPLNTNAADRDRKTRHRSLSGTQARLYDGDGERERTRWGIWTPLDELRLDNSTPLQLPLDPERDGRKIDIETQRDIVETVAVIRWSRAGISSRIRCYSYRWKHSFSMEQEACLTIRS